LTAKNFREKKRKEKETHKQLAVVLVKNILMESTEPTSTSRAYSPGHTHPCASKLKKKLFH
jgi:hypothetical protein